MKKNNGQVLYKMDHVSKIFGNRYVLNDISLEIKIGEIFGVIGTSGSGKTTILNLLIGFIKPEKGTIYYRDPQLVDIENPESFLPLDEYLNELKKISGFAAQNPSFYPNLTVEENLKYFGSLYNMPKESIELNLNNLLHLTNLKQSQHVLAKNLSGGMQRRLDIACSLIHSPKILILDEPSADLDPFIADQIWNLIKIINQRGTTIILSSHHLVQLENICDRVAIIKENKIVALGKPGEIKSKTAVDEKICLQTIPGNYKHIIAYMKRSENKNRLKEVNNYEIKDNYLMIHTKKPRVVLPEILHIMDRLGEKVANIETIKPKLDQVFITITEDGTRRYRKERSRKKNHHGKKKIKKLRKNKR